MINKNNFSSLWFKQKLEKNDKQTFFKCNNKEITVMVDDGNNESNEGMRDNNEEQVSKK